MCSLLAGQLWRVKDSSHPQRSAGGQLRQSHQDETLRHQPAQVGQESHWRRTYVDCSPSSVRSVVRIWPICAIDRSRCAIGRSRKSVKCAQQYLLASGCSCRTAASVLFHAVTVREWRTDIIVAVWSANEDSSDSYSSFSLQCFDTVQSGLLVVTFWTELCTSYSSSCYDHLHHP